MSKIKCNLRVGSSRFVKFRQVNMIKLFRKKAAVFEQRSKKILMHLMSWANIDSSLIQYFSQASSSQPTRQRNLLVNKSSSRPTSTTVQWLTSLGQGQWNSEVLFFSHVSRDCLSQPNWSPSHGVLAAVRETHTEYCHWNRNNLGNTQSKHTVGCA